MAEDPFRRVADAPLFVVPRMLEALRAFRARPGLDVELQGVTDRLIAGVEAHPTRFWVLKQFQPVLEAARDGSAETRERVGADLGQLMDILGLERADGLLAYYRLYS
jgi:hypothetical protein